MAFHLNDYPLSPLTLREIKPTGWVLNQLKIEAAGLAGNLDKVWPDIKDSNWIGGTIDSWERVPYWLDGFIPLAYLLDDEDMKERAKFYIDNILARQEADGWLMPLAAGAKRAGYDMWAYILTMKVLVVYYEASEDPRIEDAIYRACQAFSAHIDGTPLKNWGAFRWYEALYPIYWLYERRTEQWLVLLIKKIAAQGFDWASFFEDDWPCEKVEDNPRWGYMNHVVNNVEMMKSGPMYYRFSGKESDLQSPYLMRQKLEKAHGMITGVVTGDECLSGTSPVQGTELCAVVEYMQSIEKIIEATGDLSWGDLLERITFNALPAAMSPDMWTHQYDQQVNQMRCAITDDPVFRTNNGEANLFGLEPHFGCCTANHGQGWPRFAQSTVMKTKDGLAILSYTPTTVQTTIHNIPVTMEITTDYPFRDEIKFKITTNKEVDFTLHLRIPEWVESATIDVGNDQLTPPRGSTYQMAGSWAGETEFTLKLASSYVLNPRPNNLYAVTRGPLVMAMPLEEKWIRVHEDDPKKAFPHCDYEVRPTSEWRYGFTFPDKKRIKNNVSETSKPMNDCPFSPQNAPLEAFVYMRKIEWDIIKGSAAPTPAQFYIPGKEEIIRMIPYGCTNLRMTELPIVK